MQEIPPAPSSMPPWPTLGSRMLHAPSARLGRIAAVVMFGAIGLIVLVTVVAAQGTDDLPIWQTILFVGGLVGLLVGDGLALVAVFRRGERSWLLLLPAALITLAIVNELIQGVLILFGQGE